MRGFSPSYNKGEVVLAQLVCVISILTTLCLLLPLIKRKRSAVLSSSESGGFCSDACPLALYFTMIGAGFIFIEMSQMQRLVVFLGHPAYSITIVLFSLLVSSGLGSYTTATVKAERLMKATTARLSCLLLTLAAYWFAAPKVLDYSFSYETPVRILVSSALLLPVGFFMGMAFPLGFKIADLRFSELKPWLWGLNGAASVLATVLSLAVAIGLGLKASYITGCLCYLIALGAHVWNYKPSTGKISRFDDSELLRQK